MEAEIRRAWHAQIDQLALLPVGWNDVGSAPMDPEIIAAAHRLADELPTTAGELARIMPLARGCLQWEYRRGKRSLEIEFESPTQLRFYQCDPTERFENEECFPTHDRTTLGRLVAWFAVEG